MKKQLRKVLVVAPRFPSINQPWIDTYLRGLLYQSLEPIIFSANRKPDLYDSEVVDSLGLRSRVIPFSFKKSAQILSLIKLIMEPSSLVRAWKVAQTLRVDGASLLIGWLKCLHFTSSRKKIGEFEIIHSHEEILAYEFLALAKLRNVPLVFTFHGLPPVGVGQLGSAKRRILYKYAVRIFVNTEFARQQVASLGCDLDKIIVLPQGLPIEKFRFLSRAAPRAGEPVHLLSVGRYHRDKGQGYALLALRRLLDKGVTATWKFVGVGPDRQRLEKLVKKLRLSEHVLLLEGVSFEQLTKIYHESHLFVLASITSPGGHVETQGVVLQEAQASGCIPIASRVGGIPECVNHQKDALLVKEKSSRSIASAVQYLLERPEEWATYQEAGRRNVKENYSAAVIEQRMAELLRNVIESWKGCGDVPIAQSAESA